MKAFSIAILALFATLATLAPSAQAITYGDCRDTHGGIVACGCDGTLPSYASCGTIQVACSPVVGGIVTVEAASTSPTTIWSMRLQLSSLGWDYVGEDGHTWTGGYTYGGALASGRMFTASLYADGVFLASASIFCA